MSTSNWVANSASASSALILAGIVILTAVIGALFLVLRQWSSRVSDHITTLRTEQGQMLGASMAAMESRLQARLHEQLQGGFTQNLKNNFQHLEKVQEYIAATEHKLGAIREIGASVSELNLLLKLPHLRGGFGEGILEHLLADFLAPSSFALQYAVTPGSAERVDAAVKIVNRWLPIDSKFPREQILPLFESSDPEELAHARQRLSEVVRIQAKSIAAKYIRPENGTTDYALIFLPSETLYAEVIRSTKTFEALTALKVFPTSPSTLALTLHSIASAREYYELAQGVEKSIEDLQRSRKHLATFRARFDDLGRLLGRTSEAYELAERGLENFDASIEQASGKEAGGDAGGADVGGSNDAASPSVLSS